MNKNIRAAIYTGIGGVLGAYLGEALGQSKHAFVYVTLGGLAGRLLSENTQNTKQNLIEV